MKVLLRQASKLDYYKIIEISNLDELLKIYTTLIVDSDKNTLAFFKKHAEKSKNAFELVVTIYDDYFE